MQMPVGDGSDTREPRHSDLRGFDQLKRAIDFAERPQCQRQIDRGPEAESCLKRRA
jgi:hypothetical protein